MATVTFLKQNSDNAVSFTTKMSGNVVSAVSIKQTFQDPSGNAIFSNREVSASWVSANSRYDINLTNSDCSGTAGPWFLKYVWTWGSLTTTEYEEVHIVDRDMKYCSYADVIALDPQRLGPQATTSGTVVNIDHIYRYCLNSEAMIDGVLDSVGYERPITDQDLLEYVRVAGSKLAASDALNSWFPTRVGEYGFNGREFQRQGAYMLGQLASGEVVFETADRSDRLLPSSLGTVDNPDSLADDEIWNTRDKKF